MPGEMEMPEFCTKILHNVSVSHPPNAHLICVLGAFHPQLQGPSYVGVFRSKQGADAADSSCPQGMGEPPAHQELTAFLGEQPGGTSPHSHRVGEPESTLPL